MVDDAVAFCGGLDITIRRWDTTEHRPNEPRRIDPTGASYLPFHDLQAIVDGKAALALARLVRDRWARACGGAPRCTRSAIPGRFRSPDFSAVDVGIARTLPATEETEEIREIEALFFDAIDHATSTIYIENQFLTARESPSVWPGACASSPRWSCRRRAGRAHSWLEAQACEPVASVSCRSSNGGRGSSRVACSVPHVSDGETQLDVMVHSKVMIVDDVLLHIGSANLNNRSIGLDTECDLAIEPSTADQRQPVRRTRDRLLGHHCGGRRRIVALRWRLTDSLIKTALALSRQRPSSCVQWTTAAPKPRFSRRSNSSLTRSGRFRHRPFWRISWVAAADRGRCVVLPKSSAVGIVIAAFALAWSFTPFPRFAYPDLFGIGFRPLRMFQRRAFDCACPFCRSAACWYFPCCC